MLSSQPLSPGAGGLGMVDLLALLVTVPRDSITLTEFLVFLMLGGGERTWGVEEEAMLNLVGTQTYCPCPLPEQGDWAMVIPAAVEDGKSGGCCSLAVVVPCLGWAGQVPSAVAA